LISTNICEALPGTPGGAIGASPRSHGGQETMTTAEAKKKMRGTKRVCQSCAVPFYDLSRDPIVCPSCGAHYALDARPAQDETGASAAFARKPPWGQGFRGQHRATADEPAASEPAAPLKEDGEENEAVTETEADEDLHLEQEQEDTDVSDLLNREDDEDDGERS
jgi:uncharacterized protein (TIGR02300 family)